MKFSRTGIILNTENFDRCKEFYGSVLGLPTLEHFGRGDDEIIVFSLGDCYLMVEHDGTARSDVKPVSTCPTKFRFNVADIDAACAELRSKGVALTVIEHPWGTTAEFADPDGNRCALRSDDRFSA